MDNIQIFNFENYEVRTTLINGEPYFVGKDVAEILGYTNTKDAIKNHVEPEDKTVIQRSQMATLENFPNRGLTLINESGLYSLIFSSKLENAKKFKHWVTSEVLPSIRKNGGYIYNQDNLTAEQILANAIKVAEKVIADKDKLIEEMRPKAIFADAVSCSDSTILIGDLAKILKGKGVTIGAKRLFEFLRDKSYLIKQKGTAYNMPTQRSMELGLFKIKETAITHSDGHISINKTPKVTGKGQQYFINLFLNKGAI